MNLRVLVSPRRKFDLPPKWDGLIVDWGHWSETRTTLALHMKPEDLACRECGSVDESMVCHGRRRPEPGTVEKVPVPKRTRSGKPYTRMEEHPARAVMDLAVFRCRHCEVDHVWDMRTDEWWKLEPEDYTAEGSTPVDTLF